MVAVGNGAEAERFFHAQLAIAERLAATDPTSAGFQRDLSVSHVRLGDLAAGTDHGEDAIGHFQASLDIWRRLAETSPSVVDYRYGQRVPLERLARLLADRDADTAAGCMSDYLAIVTEGGHRRGAEGAIQVELGAAIDAAAALRIQLNATASPAALADVDDRTAAAPQRWARISGEPGRAERLTAGGVDRHDHVDSIGAQKPSRGQFTGVRVPVEGPLAGPGTSHGGVLLDTFKVPKGAPPVGPGRRSFCDTPWSFVVSRRSRAQSLGCGSAGVTLGGR